MLYNEDCFVGRSVYIQGSDVWLSSLQTDHTTIRTMNKIAIFLALVLFAGCYAQLTPGEGALLSAFALPFILNAGQLTSGQGVLPPPITGDQGFFPGGVYPGQGPIIIHRRYYNNKY